MRMLEIILILISTYITLKVLKNVEKDNYHLSDEQIKDEVNPEDVMVFNTEEISGQIYVWNKVSSEFITQGKDIDQIVEFIRKNYPNKKVILTRSANEEDGIQANG
jgi:hypothetical protein